MKGRTLAIVAIVIAVLLLSGGLVFLCSSADAGNSPARSVLRLLVAGVSLLAGAGLERAAPDARIINLETAITVSDRYRPKGINYRMHPANIGCLTAAGVDCCALANNHVLDWGVAGLEETLATLDVAGIRRAGAGRDLEEGMAPAVLSVPGKGRVLTQLSLWWFDRLGDITPNHVISATDVPREWAGRAIRCQRLES